MIKYPFQQKRSDGKQRGGETDQNRYWRSSGYRVDESRSAFFQISEVNIIS